MEWHTHEFEERHRNPDWYWTVGLVGIGGTILALIFGNVIFGIFILVGTSALLLESLRKPRLLTYETDLEGVRVGSTLYPYQTLEAFWITHTVPQHLLIKSQKLLAPLISIPLGGEVDPVLLREELLLHLDEEELSEPFAERIMEYFGF